MAPISKFFIAALCVVAASPVLSAPIQSSDSLSRRQLAGEGAAADAIFSDTDNGVGYGTENAEDNLASLITSTKGAGTPAKRQLDKVANGFGTLANAAGAGGPGGVIQNSGDTVDGQLTEDAANDGTEVGSAEETTLEQAGSDVPSSI